MEAFGDGTAQSSVTSLFKVAGGWGNVNGPGLFMLRVIVVGSTAAAFFGLTGAVAGSIMYGTASLPFLLASSFGFVLGSFRWYHSSTSQALLCLDAYPRLMQLHLDANYPSKRFRQWPAERMKLRTFQNSWILKSMLVVAWLTAQPALDDIMSAEESLLIADVNSRREMKLITSGTES